MLKEILFGKLIFTRSKAFLIKDNRISDFERSTVDRQYQERLLVEYGIIEKR
ncbi:MAG: hypothetical protein K6E85_08805 [Lachnospiraceae bacterium]|nr:hypothetical protein [Lachnospiraceae bacterium]